MGYGNIDENMEDTTNNNRDPKARKRSTSREQSIVELRMKVKVIKVLDVGEHVFEVDLKKFKKEIRI
jgi:hypothetical protein